MSSDTSYGKERNTNLDPRSENPLQILNGVEQAVENSETYSEVVQEFQDYKQRIFEKENNCSIEDDRLFKALISEYEELSIEQGETEAVEAYSSTVSEMSSKYDEWAGKLADEVLGMYHEERAQITQNVSVEEDSNGVEIL